MEPVTHVLTGVCLGRSGFNRKAAYATLTLAIAAELPDIDTLWGLQGPVEGFTHHRGITHTFLGVPLEAALLVAAVWGVHAWRSRGRETPGKATAFTPSSLRERSFAKEGEAGVPVRWGWLYLCAVVGLLSHLLLDWTNNYGLRPFFPFDRRWFAGSFVFIFDPWIFLLLLGALVMPPLFGLIAGEVGAKKRPFRGRGWAIAALVGEVGWWGLRFAEHSRAVEMAMGQSYAQLASDPADDDTTDVNATPASQQRSVQTPDAAPTYLGAQRALASPDMLNPFRWWAVMDFGPLYQLAEVDARRGEVTVGPTTYPKPAHTAEVLAAEASPLGRAYIDWSPMPLVQAGMPWTGESADSVERAAPGETTVTFRDPRFMRPDSLGSALTGRVKLDAAGRVVGEEMDGRKERQ
jgi:inner membrane protein